MLEYKNIIRALWRGECEDLICDAMAHSFPLPTRDDDGSLTDNFFLYNVSFPSGAEEPPFAHIGIHADTGKLVLSRMGDAAGFPAPPPAAPPELAYETYIGYVRQYEALYPAVRCFAYSNFLMPDQLNTLIEFFHVQRSLFDSRMRYYRHIAPGFYDWMIRMAAPYASYLDQCASGDADTSDLKLYLAMAGDDAHLQQTVLGMNDAEFSAWQEKGSTALRTILFSRMTGENFAEYDSWPDERKLAARSYDPDALEDIRHDDT